MKTTVEINAEHLALARKILKTRTIKDTVEKSLEAVIRYDDLESLASAAGAFDLDLTATTLRLQRSKRATHAPR